MSKMKGIYQKVKGRRIEELKSSPKPTREQEATLTPLSENASAMKKMMAGMDIKPSGDVEL